MYAVAEHTQSAQPAGVREEVTDKSPRRLGDEGLVGSLAVVKVYRLAAMAPMYVAKDVQLRPYSPNFLQETGTA